jgi:hypothetical protein
MHRKQRRSTQGEVFEEFYRRERDRAAERRRNRQIRELESIGRRPAILPSTKRWIAEQIERLKSGAAIGEGGAT